MSYPLGVVWPIIIIDLLNSVRYTVPMNRPVHRIRKSISRGTPSYQLGHYEMSGEKGERRSVFKIDVHLGEHATAEDALSDWPREIYRLRQMGRQGKADKLQSKVDRLREITERE